MKQQYRILFCDTCQTWTRHELTQGGHYYVCGCGTLVMVLVNNAKPMEAIK